MTGIDAVFWCPVFVFGVPFNVFWCPVFMIYHTYYCSIPLLQYPYPLHSLLPYRGVGSGLSGRSFRAPPNP